MKDKLLTSVLFAAVFLALGSTALASTTWYVNGVSGSDSNACKTPTTACKTIGHAISLALSGDSIMVAAATYKENLTIGFSLKILGSGAGTTIINGGGIFTVVTISSATAHVTLSGVTIYNGSAFSGAGIFNSGTLTLIASTVIGNTVLPSCLFCHSGGGGISNSGTLTISRSTIFDNHVAVTCRVACFARGGGIDNSGTLTISNSTVSGNGVGCFSGIYNSHCDANGGGIYNGGRLSINQSTIRENYASLIAGTVATVDGGGINNGGTAIISNSTISGNSAIPGNGGGIDNFGTAIISNSTISGNSAKFGGGISGTVTLQNSIVANSPSGGNCNGTMTSNGYNLSSDATCSFTNSGDLNHTDPQLGPLQNNGGPTQTMALPSGSPAVDAGNPNGCTDGLGHLLKTDQRGDRRPNIEDTGGCDMGAYERQSD